MGATLIVVVGMKSDRRRVGTARSGPCGGRLLTYIGAAFGGHRCRWLADGRHPQVRAFGCGDGSGRPRALVRLGGPAALYAGHGVLMGLFGTYLHVRAAADLCQPLVSSDGAARRWLDLVGPVGAGTIWPPLLQLGIDTIGWRQTMLLYAVLVVVGVGAITLAFLHPPPAQGHQPMRALGGPGATLRRSACRQIS
jgi:hypothetical protein